MDAVSQCRAAVQDLVARVLRRSKDDPDVEDCTHETLRRALEQKKELRPGHPLLPWVLGIARHVALDALRHHYRKGKLLTGSRSDPSFLVESQPDPRAGPERRAVLLQDTRRLQVALEQLPEGQRQAIVLFYIEQLSYREISARLDVPVATVGTWMLRAREHLALALGERSDA